MIDYSIPAIPTVYRGRKYRSRLEARWAAYFDMIGWQFEYEPTDLGSWSPDFLIRTQAKPILVEVKPITELEPSVCKKMATAVRASRFECSLLLLGIGPFAATEHDNGIAIGWFGSISHPYPFGKFPLADWFEAIICQVDGRSDIFSGIPVAEVAGIWDFDIEAAQPAFAMGQWASATNLVQWNGRRG